MNNYNIPVWKQVKLQLKSDYVVQRGVRCDGTAEVCVRRSCEESPQSGRTLIGIVQNFIPYLIEGYQDVYIEFRTLEGCEVIGGVRLSQLQEIA